VSEDRGPTFKRARSHQDRDVYTPKTKTPTSVPQFVSEDITSQYSGEDLRRARSRRPTPERIAHLEDKHDQLSSVVCEMRVDLAEIRGDTKVQNASLATISKTLDRMAAREDVEHAADVDVDAEQKKDAIAAGKARRDAVIKVALYIITGGLLGKILHTLGLL
jgi:hypothetical protein